MAETYSAGIVTAYGAAVRGGYTGTYEEFCAEQASFAENAEQVAQDREAMETLAAQFIGTTVPAAVQTVQNAGAAQIQAVEAASETEQQQIAAQGAAQETRVTQAGSDQVAAIQAAGETQVGNVNAAGTTQVGNVNTAGTTQVNAVQAKGQEVIDSIPEDFTDLQNEVGDLKSAVTNAEGDIDTLETALPGKVNKPVSSPDGTNGQLLRTNGDGTTTWVDQGLPTDAQTTTAVATWLNAHPEATTTVQDGSLTESKFSDALKLKTINGYVTPEMFGAKGDGVTDDSSALQAAIDSGEPVYLPAGTYNVATPLFVSGIVKLELANGATIKAVGNAKPYLIGLRNDGNTYPLAEREYIKGGVIDGNGLCDVVIGVNYSHGMIEHCIVKGIKHYGIYNLHNTAHPNVGSGNLLVFHTRLLGDPTVTGTIGFGQGGGDCLLISTTAQDVETGFQVGSDKLSDCHAWISRNDIFPNSVAFDVVTSGGQLVNCVSDTMRYGIKSALNYVKFTVANFSYYFNAGVTPATYLNEHQPIVINLTGRYPLAVFSNVEVDLAKAIGKIINDELISSTTVKFVNLSLNGIDNAVSANTPFDIATPYNVIRSVKRSGSITLDELNNINQTCIIGGYSAITGLVGWATVVTFNLDGGTLVQTFSVAGGGSKTRRKAGGSWSEFS